MVGDVQGPDIEFRPGRAGRLPGRPRPGAQPKTIFAVDLDIGPETC
jgi:hypothetical protein